MIPESSWDNNHFWLAPSQNLTQNKFNKISLSFHECVKSEHSNLLFSQRSQSESNGSVKFIKKSKKDGKKESSHQYIPRVAAQG